MAARLLFAVLIGVCLANLVSAGCHTTESYEEVGCHTGRYSAPAITGIIAGEPTTLAKASIQHSDGLGAAMLNLISGAIGLLPGGAFLSGMFNALGAVIGGGTDTNAVLTNMYNQLVTELNNLRLYVDKRIEQASIIWLRQQLGDANGGLMGVALKCTSKTGSALKTELNLLHTALVNDYHHFLPASATIVSYEKTLPLFRHYGDLFITTLMSEIAVMKELGETDAASQKVQELQRRVREFEAHWDRALAAILADHARLPQVTCCTFNKWLGWWAFANLAYYQSDCTTEMGYQTCKTKAIIGCAAPGITSGVGGRSKALDWATSGMNRRRSIFVSNRKSDLQAYWNKQIGEVVSKWKKISSAAGRIQEEYLMNASEEEQEAYAVEEESTQQSNLGNDFILELTDEDENQYIEALASEVAAQWSEYHSPVNRYGYNY